MNILDLLVFVVFVAAVISIGLWKSRGEELKSEHAASDYFLAGRGLKWWLIGFSLIAANISTEQFVGMSGNAASHIGMAIASYEWMAAITLVVVAFAFLPYFPHSRHRRHYPDRHAVRGLLPDWHRGVRAFSFDD
jgi:SSS family solute:Na+ symporter